MPPPRKPSPRHKERRTRSRSYSPKHSRRRKSRSPKRRSRSPQRKQHSRNRNHSKSPHVSRKSRSPKRRSPPSPRPVKRPADSSGRRSYRSKSRSATPPKKIRDERFVKEPSPRHSAGRRQRSPSPQIRQRSPVRRRRSPSPSPYRGKAHMDKPSSSKQPLFPVEKKKNEIDFVKIIDLGPKEILDKRFQTLEQLAQGSFEFEENITIGIHRGPQHIELDEDVPVSYEFNRNTFIMLYPKKNYSKAIFDRDEIKAFHHDDILDEEAYVEKRTITVKPSQKQRPKWMDEYKITVGQDREGYGDKRMVQDSKSRRHRSRTPDYEQEVKVRLDPKPDPRYERLYRNQQRQEEAGMHENIHRNPNDLRYNLIKRKTDFDRDRSPGRDRDMDRGREGGRFDARSKIEERRRESWSDDRGDRRGDRRDVRQSPGRSYGDKRKQDLPDFKNRPDDYHLDSPSKRPRQRWGHCQLCDVSLYSEEEAVSHVATPQHQSRENPSHNFEDNQRRASLGNRDDQAQQGRFVRARSVDFRGRDGDTGFTDKFQYDAWKNNPEEIPKGPGYYEHDNRSRDDMNFWERKQMYLKTGRYPERGSARGRGFRGTFRGRFSGGSRGGFRGRGTFRRTSPNPYSLDRRRKSDSANDEWKHDKFSELEGPDSTTEGREEKKRDNKHHKDNHKDTKNKGSSERKSKKDDGEKGEKDAAEILSQEENMKIDVNVELN